MTPSPKISVVMAVYNGEAYVANAIRSVARQTYTNWELLVVDDGSTDRSSSIVQLAAGDDRRFVLTETNHGGQAHARNHAIAIAVGDYIAFLDQDDLWEPRKLERQVEALTDGSVGVVFSDGYIFEDADLGDESRTFHTLVGEYSGREMHRLLLLSNQLPTLTAVIRRALLSQIGALDARPEIQGCDDYDLWLRLAAAGARFLGIGERLVRYRTHPGAWSRKRARMLEAELRVFERHATAIRSDPELLLRCSDLHRRIVSALLSERDPRGARRYLARLHRYHLLRPGMFFQRLLLALAPAQFERRYGGLHSLPLLREGRAH